MTTGDQTSTGGQQSPRGCSLLLLEQHFHPIRFVPIANLHQSLIGPVTTVSRSQTGLHLIKLNRKLCEVIATFQLGSTTRTHIVINIYTNLFCATLHEYDQLSSPMTGLNAVCCAAAFAYSHAIDIKVKAVTLM